MPVILDLCGGTGSWSKPYRDAGYDVVIVDPLAEEDGHSLKLDVQTFYYQLRWGAFYREVHGILAAPPCTEFAGSGARWWKDKDPKLLKDALDVVDTCLSIIKHYQPKWWALENPVGRLKRYIGNPMMYFNPCDYGDPYTKKTCLLGEFTEPKKTPVEPTEGSKMHLLPPSPDRWRLRSQTPPGFAQAFYEANP